MADVLYYDTQTQCGYRITVKRLTVGDGVAVDTEQDAIANRDDLNGRLLLTLRHLPLLKYATVSAERAVLDNAPVINDDGAPLFAEDVNWQLFDVTEAEFLALDEIVSWAWLGAVLEKNPHRNTSYSALKKTLSRGMPATSSAPPMSESTPPDSSDAKTTYAA